MSISEDQPVTIPLKQRLFIGALIVLSVILASVVLFCYSPRTMSEVTPSQELHASSQVGSVEA